MPWLFHVPIRSGLSVTLSLRFFVQEGEAQNGSEKEKMAKLEIEARSGATALIIETWEVQHKISLHHKIIFHSFPCRGGEEEGAKKWAGNIARILSPRSASPREQCRRSRIVESSSHSHLRAFCCRHPHLPSYSQLSWLFSVSFSSCLPASSSCVKLTKQ